MAGFLFATKEVRMVPRVRRCRHLGCHAMVEQSNSYCSRHKDDRTSRSEANHIYNTTTRKRNNAKQEQYKFYRTREWKSIREEVLLRDDYLCQYCKQRKIINAGNIVDHVVPFEYWREGKTKLGNLITSCKSCHNAKTKWERDYYGIGLANEKRKVAKVTNVEILSKLIEASKMLIESR